MAGQSTLNRAHLYGWQGGPVCWLGAHFRLKAEDFSSSSPGSLHGLSGLLLAWWPGPKSEHPNRFRKWMLPVYGGLSSESNTVFVTFFIFCWPSSHWAQVLKGRNIHSTSWLEGDQEFVDCILKYYIALLKTPSLKSTTEVKEDSLNRSFSETVYCLKSSMTPLGNICYCLFLITDTTLLLIPSELLLWFLPDLPKQRLIHYTVMNNLFCKVTSARQTTLAVFNILLQ